MAKEIRTATRGQVELIDEAISHLRIARDKLLAAEAPRAAVYVRRSLKSAEGAKRHGQHRLNRTHEERVEEIRRRLLTAEQRRHNLAEGAY